MGRMRECGECGCAHVENGLLAVRAVRRVQAEVVRLAVRAPVLLKEVAVPQFALALGAHEVFGVPHPPQRRHHLRRAGALWGNRGVTDAFARA